MEILYASTLCSESKFDSISSTGMVKPEVSVQKFHLLMVKGFVSNDCHIETLSPPPVSRSSHARLFWKKEVENAHGIKFHYLFFINYPFLRQVTIFLSGFFSTIFWILRHPNIDKMILCDILNVSVSASALLAARLFRIQVVGIVTDLPRMIVLPKKRRKSMIEKIAPVINEMLNNSYSSYVLFSKKMYSYINRDSHPTCFIEGVVDVNMYTVEPEKDKSFRTIIYAGELGEESGVKFLIEAFRNLKGDDLRLSIYGSGDLVQEMDLYKKLDNRLYFFGDASITEIMEATLKATLLVHTPFTNVEFTKYSFPSKILEYMLSGVPVLSTCLPAMPLDYYDYVYLLKDETLNGFIKKLAEIVSLPEEKLKLKGKSAREFILREKNNVNQSRKILEMVKTECIGVGQSIFVEN